MKRGTALCGGRGAGARCVAGLLPKAPEDRYAAELKPALEATVGDLALAHLDAEQLAYVALKPGGAFASLPRDELVRRILRRADAWNFRGKRAKWVEELVASLEAS